MMIHFIIAFVLSFSIGFADDPCRFEYLGKGVIDLTTVGHIDGTVAFADRKETPTSSYRTSMMFYLNC
jgi:hypothetical protein